MSTIKVKTPQEDHLWISDIDGFEFFENREQLINYLLDRRIYRICNDLDTNLPMYELSDIQEDRIWNRILIGIISFSVLKNVKKK